jgi:hypothetical protein
MNELSTRAKPEIYSVAKPKTPCACGGAGCVSCANCSPGVLLRPRFFAGQLLTEDDLQLLSDYVAAKSRLHNRFLHGWGVVCGLEVSCHPCGGGMVIVRPGHALDCCGNDITVPCPVELDINAMVRDLRTRQLGGYDCGDPCEEPKKNTQKKRNEDDCSPRGRRYCLYINYCEELSDPVTPYTSDEPCATQICEPTRVREGYRFELRCPEEESKPPDLFDRIRECIGDLTAADKSAGDGFKASHYAQRVQFASQKIAANEVPGFEVTDRRIIKNGVDVLNQFKDLADEAMGKIEEAKVREGLDHLLATASAVARYKLQEAAKLPEPRELETDIEKARDSIKQAAPNLGTLAERKLVSPIDRIIAKTWQGESLKWIDTRLPPEERHSPEGLRFAYAAPYSAAMNQEFSNALNQLREWLLNRIDKRPLHGDCKLRDEIWSIRIPEETRVVSETFANAALRLARLLLRYLIDCICAALNPPCPPCEDPGVKLACLEVDDCEVIYICNLERTYVLSAVALRYWIPLLHQIGEALEKLCCDLTRRLSVPLKEKPQPQFEPQPRYFRETQSAYRFVEGQAELPAILNILRVNEDTARSTINLGGNLAAIFRHDPAFAMQRLVTPAFEVPGRLREVAAAAAGQERVNELTRSLEDLTKRIVSLEGRRGGKR